MDFSKINTSMLRQMLKLSERKEVLLNELKKIEAEIFSCLNNYSKTEFSSSLNKEYSFEGQKEGSAGKRATRGLMQQQILQALAEAGPAGIKVPDLAQKIGAKNANVHVWFSNTGKKLPEIERVGAGHFRLRQDS